MIDTRLSTLSINEEEFYKAKPLYETALKNSGFNGNLKFQSIQTTRSRNRLRKVIWFNPPYNVEVKTNIRKIFLKLVRKHFQKRHPSKKIFNNNTIKLSYSCTPNVKNLIKQHNTSIMKNSPETNNGACNCRTKDNCPLDGKCLSECMFIRLQYCQQNKQRCTLAQLRVVSKAGTTIIQRSFHLRVYEHETELSKHIWSLKDINIEFSTKWCIKSKAIPYKCGSQNCELCLAEKVAVARYKGDGLLNKRTELLSKCRHRNKFIIANVK